MDMSLCYKCTRYGRHDLTAKDHTKPFGGLSSYCIETVCSLLVCSVLGYVCLDRLAFSIDKKNVGAQIESMSVVSLILEMILTQTTREMGQASNLRPIYIGFGGRRGREREL